MTKKTHRRFDCPTEFALEVLGGKWKTVILCYLRLRPCRYGELRQWLPKLSDKVLTERLRELVDRGLVAKRALAGKSTDVYALTQRGQTLKAPLGALYAWGRQNARAFGVEVDEPMRRFGSGS
jgi:DNA-binding HxlR family transcriptional regulator